MMEQEQKQIEEMVKTAVDREKNYVIGETECKKCNLNKCDLHCNIHSEISYDCETLYNAGYRKAEEVRKETAKEILQGLYDHCFELVDPFGDDCEECYGSCDKYYILAIATQYGVEVEE